MTTTRETAKTEKGTAGKRGPIKAAARKAPSAATPHKLTLRSYQVGFGDCYLLTFHYGTENRHVLVDFGSTAKPDDAPGDLLLRVAQDIRERCRGKLHVVVATHRHKDHISGFATGRKGDGPGDIILGCNPDVIIQPWTEDPEARKDAKKATTTASGKSIAFTDTLLHMQDVAAAVTAEVSHLRMGIGPAVAGELAFLGEDNISNRSAVENLIEMGKRGRALYVNYDFNNPLDLAAELPGVTVRALGPPTLEQSEAIKKMKSSDAAEFWQLSAAAGRPVVKAGEPLFPEFAARSVSLLSPPHTRWFIRRMNAIRGSRLLHIVRILDSVMNNTSVILLFEVGGKKLLFPGDAQIENWSYALMTAPEKEQVLALLEDVDVYKVGHHGSRNANPKSLWNLFSKKGAQESLGRLKTFVSTMPGKHGDPGKRTEVPRGSLVAALKKESDYFTTEDLKPGALSKAFTINLRAT